MDSLNDRLVVVSHLHGTIQGTLRVDYDGFCIIYMGSGTDFVLFYFRETDIEDIWYQNNHFFIFLKQ